ncbi:MAG: cytochrome o ubiquinol oxidase subunit I [Buchnera aphidicola (Tetraneura akinire)]
MFGKLTIAAIPYHEPIIFFTFIIIMIIGAFLFASITYFKKWKYLWNEWFTSVDHKKIAIMYFFVALIMFFRGFVDALMMRMQQFLSSGDNGNIVGNNFVGKSGYLTADHYDQIFTAHGVIMIFFVAMPLVIGIMNFVVPLQIGARDLAFPILNNLSFWLTVTGAVIINLSFFIGEFARTGWLSYPPLSGIKYSPGVGVDYWIWSLQLAGIGTTMTAINFIVTILKMRAKGMSLFKMPIFTWTSLCTNVLILASFPVLTATLLLLTLDRYFNFHLFTTEMGGNPMMYVNLIWIWGHPEVYILVLPAFGIFSEIVSTFSRKSLFGYFSLVWATISIMVLSFVVWLHHFFTMGAGANVNSFFGISTMVIAIPTGVKIFNWLFTMYRGRLYMHTSLLWTIGFLVTFTIGGMTGILLSLPSIDFMLHNSLFLVAHFHNVIIGGVLFGSFAGISYWFPKIFGFILNEKWGKRAFWFWITGFFIAFIPLYFLGLMGMTRRLSQHINPEFHYLLAASGFGTILIFIGIICQVIQFYVSVRDKNLNLDLTGDPWNGRTLEWSTCSPPPIYNFSILPVVKSKDDFWRRKIEQKDFFSISSLPEIKIPKNTNIGFFVGLFSVFLGFSAVWHISWMFFLSLFLIFFTFFVSGFNTSFKYSLSSKHVKNIEIENLLKQDYNNNDNHQR